MSLLDYTLSDLPLHALQYWVYIPVGAGYGYSYTGSILAQTMNKVRHGHCVGLVMNEKTKNESPHNVFLNEYFSTFPVYGSFVKCRYNCHPLAVVRPL